MATMTAAASSEMQKYRFKARNKLTGKIESGTVTAASTYDVARELGRRQMMALEVKPGTGLLTADINIGGRSAPKTKSLALAFRQLATIVSAGIEIGTALEEVAKQVNDKVLNDALVRIHQRVIREGVGLSKTMEEFDFFTTSMRSMIKAGEDSGKLDEVLTRIADSLEDEVALRGKIKSALTYPFVLLALAMVAVVAMLTFVVPVFAKIYNDLDSALPWPTQALVALSKSMIVIIPVMAVVAIVGSYWWSKNRHTEKVRRRIDPLKLSVPLFGPLFQKMAMDRFARSLSTLTSSGISLVSALEISSETAGNVVVRDATLEVAKGVGQGRKMSEEFARHEKVYPSLMISMVATGDKTATMPAMLAKSSEYFKREVENTTDALKSLIEPLSTVVLGLIIGALVVALYMPYFHLSDAIG